MKFKDKVGNIYETNNKFVIEQMKKSKSYEEVKETVKNKAE